MPKVHTQKTKIQNVLLFLLGKNMHIRVTLRTQIIVILLNNQKAFERRISL